MVWAVLFRFPPSAAEKRRIVLSSQIRVFPENDLAKFSAVRWAYGHI